MALKATPVSRCLDKRLQIGGFDIPDLLAIFFTLSILNVVFGKTSLKLPFVWGPTLAMAITLRMGKRGKPENHLFHWMRFHLRPRELFAYPEPSQWQPLPTSPNLFMRD